MSVVTFFRYKQHTFHSLNVDFLCIGPVYTTSFRGPTYVFLSTLKTQDPCSKWVLTGTAILMQTDT